jgi:hypothetical protein
MTNSSDKVKAEVAKVQLGTLEIDGILLPDDNFAIAIPQIAILFPYFQDSPNQASQKLKRLMGSDFKTHKVTTVFNRNATLSISLEQFLELIKSLTLKNDEVATNMLFALAGLSLHQLFCDAFDIHFEKQERQAWLERRDLGKLKRRTVTDSTQDWLNNYGYLMTENERKFVWSNLSEKVNLGVFGRTSKTLRTAWNVPKSALLRDYMKRDELSFVEQVEDVTARILDIGGAQTKPVLAVDNAVKRLLIPVQTR